MFNLSYWDWYCDRRDLFSWFHEVMDQVYQRYASRSWQASKVTTATAMVEDIDRPDEKPPPRNGDKYKPSQARISSDTGGFKTQ